MALPKQKNDGLFEASEAPLRRPTMTVAVSSATPVDSPVHHLHKLLETSFAFEPVVEKWPGAVRMLVLGVGVVVPWASILGLAKLVAG